MGKKHSVSLPAGDFSVSYNSKTNKVSLVSTDASYSVSVDPGSDADLDLRRKLVRADIIPRITLTSEVTGETIPTVGRPISVEVSNDKRKASELGGIGLFSRQTVIIPDIVSLTRWMEMHDIAPDVQLRAKAFTTAKNYSRSNRLDDAGMQRFLSLLVWGGERFIAESLRPVNEHNRDYTPSQFHVSFSEQLLKSSWREDTPVDYWELAYLVTSYDGNLKMDRIQINELAHLVARNRASLYTLDRPGTRYGIKSAIRAGAVQRHKIIRQFRLALKNDTALSWFMAYTEWSREHPTPLVITMNPNRNKTTPTVKSSDFYLEMLFELARDVPFDDRKEFLTKAEPYNDKGIFDYQLILTALATGVDAELLRSAA